MKYLKTKWELSAPAGLPAPYLTKYRAKAICRSLNILLLVVFCSCSSMKINGIDVSKKHRKVMSDRDKRIYVATAIAGFAIGTHFKDKLKKK